MITIPLVVAIVSLSLWLILDNLAEKMSGRPVSWAIDVCRILFAASALVVLYAVANKSLL